MSNKIHLPNQLDSTHINIYQNNKIFIITINRQNFHELKTIPLLKQNGIYILYNQYQVYIGQNSSKDGLINRLNQHQHQKDWWTNAILFGSTTLTLTKAHLDYMERTLIQRFKQKHNLLENKNNGNQSPITDTERFAAEQLMSTAFSILQSILNIDLFTITNQTLYIQTHHFTIISNNLDNIIDQLETQLDKESELHQHNCQQKVQYIHLLLKQVGIYYKTNIKTI